MSKKSMQEILFYSWTGTVVHQLFIFKSWYSEHVYQTLFCSLYRIIHYIKCNMPIKSSKWELGFVHYIAKFTTSRFAISRFECTLHSIRRRQLRSLIIDLMSMAHVGKWCGQNKAHRSFIHELWLEWPLAGAMIQKSHVYTDQSFC